MRTLYYATAFSGEEKTVYELKNSYTFESKIQTK